MPALPVAAVEQIQRRWPDAGILAFGSDERHPVIRALLKAGVLALISKADPVESVRDAIAAVSQRKLFLSPRATELVLDRYLSESTTDERPDATPSRQLTSRESDVVRLLALGNNEREVARELDISMKTVQSHRSHSMRKLGARSTADLVRAALREGVIESE